MKTVWILFYYNSLPDLPEGCRLFSPEIMHRDFLKCNPTNTGHYQYPKFETLSYDCGCHAKDVRRFLARRESEKYVVFYTRHTSLNGKRQNKLVGYFKVGNVNIEKNGFTAGKSVLLPKEECVEISYSSRGVPVSWGDSTAKVSVEEFLKALKSASHKNISNKCQRETASVMRKLKLDHRRKAFVAVCKKCSVRNHCKFWGQHDEDCMTKRLQALYDT